MFIQNKEVARDIEKLCYHFGYFQIFWSLKQGNKYLADILCYHVHYYGLLLP